MNEKETFFTAFSYGFSFEAPRMQIKYKCVCVQGGYCALIGRRGPDGGRDLRWRRRGVATGPGLRRPFTRGLGGSRPAPTIGRLVLCPASCISIELGTTHRCFIWDNCNYRTILG